MPYFWETRDPVDVEHEMGTEVKIYEVDAEAKKLFPDLLFGDRLEIFRRKDDGHVEGNLREDEGEDNDPFGEMDES